MGETDISELLFRGVVEGTGSSAHEEEEEEGEGGSRRSSNL